MIAKLSDKDRAELAVLRDAFIQARDALKDRLNDLSNEWREEIAAKSARWRESESGAEADSRLVTLEDVLGSLAEIDIDFEMDWL